MRKKLLLPLFLFLLSISGLFLGATYVKAAPEKSKVQDEAQLFTPEQIQTLTEKMQATEEKTKATMMIATSYDLDQEDPRYAVDRTLGDYIGNDENGVLFYIDMTGRQIYISTSGNMIHYLTDQRIDNLLDDIYDAGMSSGDYFSAATTFIDGTYENFEKGIPSGHYTVDEATGKITFYKSITFFEGLLATLGALILGSLFFFSVKRNYQLKKPSYHYNWQENSRLDLTAENDTLVNSFITTRRIPKPQNNSGSGGGGSTTHSSGGGTFGGGSRGF